MRQSKRGTFFTTAMLMLAIFGGTAQLTASAAEPAGSVVGWGRQVVGGDLSQGFVRVAGGSSHSLGLKADGSLVTWGDNGYGQSNVPVPNSGFVAVAAGFNHSLGLKSDGSIVAWGDNAVGQTNVPAPNAGFVAIAAGGNHNLGLKADGSIVAWGDNFYGQINVPAPNTGFIAVAGGGYHSLGLKADGSIVGWGYNVNGQTNVPAPNTGFIAVAAGVGQSLGLKADGSIVGWGYNGNGETNVPAPNTGYIAVAGGRYHSLGLKANGSIVGWGSNSAGQTNVPAPNTGFTAVAAGWLHSLGVKSDGSIVAWGDNTSGQTNVPAPNTGITAVAAGRNHTLGLKTDGSIVAWGDNAQGQTNVPAPNTGFIAVAGGYLHSLGLKGDGSIVGWGYNFNGETNVPAPNTGFIAVAAGGNHSLGLKADGSIVAWGLNTSSQANVPAPNGGFVAVAGGEAHSLGLKSDGSIVAWGGNGSGQTNVPAPNTGFTAVAAGRFHSLGLKTDGSIVAWGNNQQGQTDVPAPNTGFIGVAAGLHHSLGLKANGSIVGWGYNPFGQTNVPAPNSGFTAVAGGELHSVAIHTTIIRYVNAAAAGLNNGTSWTNAYTKLQDALAIALPGDEIWVAAGNKPYKPTQKSCSTAADCGGGAPNSCPSGVCDWDQPRAQTFQLKSGVALYGGFNGTETLLIQRNPAANVTILSGDLNDDDANVGCTQNSPDCDSFGTLCVNSFCIIRTNNAENSSHVVTGGGTDATAVIDGFRITAGNANAGSAGGGMYNFNSSPTVTNCAFSGNLANGGGGGMDNEAGSNPAVTQCAFSGNSAGGGGGGMENFVSNPAVTNCVFIGNSANGGGGMDNQVGSNPAVTNCAFSGNSATYGGGMGNAASNPTVTNCTFSGNNADQNGGGMNNATSNPTVTNCTFSLNTVAMNGGGMHNQALSSPSLVNCTLWGNSDLGGMDESAQIHTASGAPVVNYSIVQGGWSGTGSHNLSSNPLFVDADGADNIVGTADDDLRLQSGSPAIDAADTTALPLDTYDLDGDGNTGERISLDVGGNPRILDDPATVDTGVPGSGVVDMGAYEFFSDCNLNGIPDVCDVSCGAADGPCDIPGCGLSQDLNMDGVPDECVHTTGTGGTANWNDGTNWNLGGSFPDNGNGIPNLYVTLDNSLILNEDVAISSLRVLGGVTLDVSGGNLTIAASMSQTAGITPPPKLKLRLDGTIVMANGYDVSVLSDSVAVNKGGLYHSTSVTDSALTAVDIAVYAGGELSLEHDMSMTSSGRVLLDGSETNPFCQSPVVAGNVAGITPPPKLRLHGLSWLYAAASVAMSGAVEVIVDSTQPVLLGGDFDNRSVVPSLFDWTAGKLTLNGTTAQTFEVAGINLGQTMDGFYTNADALFDNCPPAQQHTNYSIGTVEVAAGANVTFVNRFANTASTGCGEALYVHNLIFQSGATVTIDNCKVYYDTLTDNGVTPTLIGCGELLSTTRPVTPSAPPGSINKNRGLALSIPGPNTAGPGTLTALRVALVELQNPVPPNLPQNPPPDFSAYEFAATCTDPGGCVRWIGEPKVFLESQDSPGSGNFMAARLQCTPLYRDWTTAGFFYVVGAEIIPSSKYDVQQFAQSCAGRESSCTAVSLPLRSTTARHGDIAARFNPPDPSTQPDALDVAAVVNKLKNLSGAQVKAIAQLQPNVPELNADVNALDIVAVVDAVKQKAYGFSGPCPCPSAVICGPAPGSVACTSPSACVTAFGAGATCVKTCSGGTNAGDPCINNTHCVGSGTCGAGFCRDRCGRCTP